ncbi:MAG: DUF393 domain-containing protein [Acidobacteria bacterium]|nr:DUF393 domain-containing protein [Acidobacteriota bacterium]
MQIPNPGFQAGDTIEAGANYLLFDGDCGICSRLSETARSLDHRNRFRIRPFQSFSETELQRFGIDYDDCTKGLQSITAGGRVRSKSGAVNYFLWSIPKFRPLVILIYLIPIILLGEIVVYRIIANNRQRISARFGLRACNLK